MDDLKKKSVTQLKAICKNYRLKGYSKMKRAELIEYITDNKEYMEGFHIEEKIDAENKQATSRKKSSGKNQLYSKIEREDVSDVRLLSFDIGMKNLSYCLLSFDAEKEGADRYVIHHWGIINVTPDDRICIGKFSNGKKCTSVAKTVIMEGQYNPFELEKEDTTVPKEYYCSRHAKQSTLPHAPQQITSSVDAASDNALYCLLYKSLDNHELRDEFLNVTHVGLEMQPNKNPRMKLFGHIVYSWFISRGMVPSPFPHPYAGAPNLKNIFYIPTTGTKLKIYKGPVLHVTVSAADKAISKNKGTRIYKNPRIEVTAPVTFCKRDKHQLNKVTAINHCKALIQDKSEFKALFESHSKQDDLSDSFLLGCWYLEYGIHKKVTKRKRKKGRWKKQAKPAAD